MIDYKVYFASFLCSIILSLVLGLIIIPLLKRLKAGQNILGYVQNHLTKSGTTTMGGFIFAMSALICFRLFSRGSNTLAFLCLAVAFAFLLVGFADDFIKIRGGKNEGLTPLQKIIFQTAISLVTAIFVYVRGYTDFFIPFLNKWIDFGIWGCFIIFFVFLATTNCVNLTDGLDGLAGGVSYLYLLLSCVLILIQINN